MAECSCTLRSAAFGFRAAVQGQQVLRHRRQDVAPDPRLAHRLFLEQEAIGISGDEVPGLRGNTLQALGYPHHQHWSSTSVWGRPPRLRPENLQDQGKVTR